MSTPAERLNAIINSLIKWRYNRDIVPNAIDKLEELRDELAIAPARVVEASVVEADPRTLRLMDTRQRAAEHQRGRTPKPCDVVVLPPQPPQTVLNVFDSWVDFENNCGCAREYLASHYKYVDVPTVGMSFTWTGVEWVLTIRGTTYGPPPHGECLNDFCMNPACPCKDHQENRE